MKNITLYMVLCCFFPSILMGTDTTFKKPEMISFAAKTYVEESKIARLSEENGSDLIHYTNNSFFYFTHPNAKEICKMNLSNGDLEYLKYEKPNYFEVSKIYCDDNWLVLFSEETVKDNIIFLSFNQEKQQYENSIRIDRGNQIDLDLMYVESDTLYTMSIYPSLQAFVNQDKALKLTKTSIKNPSYSETYSYASSLFEFYFIQDVSPFRFHNQQLIWAENNSPTMNIVDIRTGNLTKYKLPIPEAYKTSFTILSEESIENIKSSRIHTQAIQSLRALNKELDKGAILYLNLYMTDSFYNIILMESIDFKHYSFKFKLNKDTDTLESCSFNELQLYSPKNIKITQTYIAPVFGNKKILSFNNTGMISFETVHKRSRFKSIKTKKIEKYRNETIELKKPKSWLIKSSIL